MPAQLRGKARQRIAEFVSDFGVLYGGVKIFEVDQEEPHEIVKLG